MPLCVNQSGTWRNINTICVNESGTWRNVVRSRINQSGTWRAHFGAETIAEIPLGTVICGGFLICRTGTGTAWIAAPAAAEVSRDWYSRADANTRAAAVTGCSGWFVPSCGQYINPGSTCRAYWDYSGFSGYASNTASSPTGNWRILIYSGAADPNPGGKPFPQCVRSFRTVSY